MAVFLQGGGGPPAQWARVDGAIFQTPGTSSAAVELLDHGLISNCYFNSSTAGGIATTLALDSQLFVYGCTFKGIVVTLSSSLLFSSLHLLEFVKSMSL